MKKLRRKGDIVGAPFCFTRWVPWVLTWFLHKARTGFQAMDIVKSNLTPVFGDMNRKRLWKFRSHQKCSHIHCKVHIFIVLSSVLNVTCNKLTLNRPNLSSADWYQVLRPVLYTDSSFILTATLWSGYLFTSSLQMRDRGSKDLVTEVPPTGCRRRGFEPGAFRLKLPSYSAFADNEKCIQGLTTCC